MTNSVIPDATKSETKQSLMSIGDSFNALEILIIESDGEITEEVDQWLQEYEAKESDKIDAYVYLIQKYREISLEARRLAKRAVIYNNKVDGLKDRLKHYLQSRQQHRIETGRFTVSLAANGGQTPVELQEGITPEDLPEPFRKVVIEADKDKIREALLADNEELTRFARLGERGIHLRIK